VFAKRDGERPDVVLILLREAPMPAVSRYQLSTVYRSSNAPAHSIVDGGILRHRAIVLAMKGGAEGAAATCMTAAFAEARGARPTVIRAYFPAPASSLRTLASSGWIANAAAATRNGVRYDLMRTSPTAGQWPILVVAGAPSEVIAATAREVDAALIIMGLQARRGGRPTIHSETALRLVRDTTIPVLATTASLRTLPRRILVGVDFGHAGLLAARAARALLADGGSLQLAFVDTLPGHTNTDSEGDVGLRRQEVGAACERLRETLAAPTHIPVSTIVLEGEPSDALREAAERMDADIIAIGNQRDGVVGRRLPGSVTADLLHDARRSLLIVPLHEMCA
jgi:nucleotide-binding universal stress UspA family protein